MYAVAITPLTFKSGSTGNNFLDNTKQSKLLSTMNQTASLQRPRYPALSTPDNNSDASFLITNSSDKHKPLANDKQLKLQSENTNYGSLLKSNRLLSLTSRATSMPWPKKMNITRLSLPNTKPASPKPSQDVNPSTTTTSQDIEKTLNQFSNLSIENAFNKNIKTSNSRPVQDVSQSQQLPGPRSS